MIAAMGPSVPASTQASRPPALQRPRPAPVGTTDGYSGPAGATDSDFETGPELPRAAGYKRTAMLTLGIYKRAE